MKEKEYNFNDYQEIGLNPCDFCFGSYIGQERDMRKILIEDIDPMTVALLSFKEVKEIFIKKGLIPMKIMGSDDELFYLVPFETLKDFKTVER